MKEEQTAYRALPEFIENPRNSEQITQTIFDTFTGKTNMFDAPSLCKGHLGTTMWHVDGDEYRGYMLEIRLAERTVLVKSICTFTPSFGVDFIDGNIAQDIEEMVLNKECDLETKRLLPYEGRQSIPIEEYLDIIGVKGLTTNEAIPERKWWKFW